MKKNSKKKIEKSPQPTAVLLMAYGSPENIAEVEPYYTHIRHGVRPDEKLIKNLEARYSRVGGKTPLHAITKKQAAALQKMLDTKAGKGKYKVFIGMKHWHPFIKDTFEAMRKEGVKKVIAIALAPHYSKISIGGYQKALEEAAGEIAFTLIESWHTNPYLVDCIVEQTQKVLATEFKTGQKTDQKPHVIFTAHSLPERIKTWNDPYPEELLKTCRLIAKKIPGIEWSFAFQSAGMTGEPWLGPDINDALVAVGKKNILVCSIGFVCDNLEIIYDLDIESQALAAKKNINLKRVPMRNAEPLFIEALYEEVVNAR